MLRIDKEKLEFISKYTISTSTGGEKVQEILDAIELINEHRQLHHTIELYPYPFGSNNFVLYDWDSEICLEPEEMLGIARKIEEQIYAGMKVVVDESISSNELNMVTDKERIVIKVED